MIIKQLILNSLLAIVALFFFGKIIAPFLSEKINSWLYSPKKKKFDDLEFERMIEQKKSLLTKGKKSTSKDEKSYRDSNKKKSPFSNSLTTEFEKLSSLRKRGSSQEKRFSEIKKILALTQSLQWGEGKENKILSQEISQKINSRVETSSINSILQELIKREFLIRDSKILPFQNIRNKIESFAILEKFYFDQDFQNKKAKGFSISPTLLKKALFLYSKNIKGVRTSQDLKRILSENNILLPSRGDLFIIKALQKDENLSSSLIIQRIKNEVELLKTLCPLPPLKGKNDRKGAFLTMNLKENSSQEQIKKQYKNLAKLKHPDRLKGKGIPEEFEKIATENFTQIQMAYDILKK